MAGGLNSHYIELTDLIIQSVIFNIAILNTLLIFFSECLKGVLFGFVFLGCHLCLAQQVDLPKSLQYRILLQSDSSFIMNITNVGAESESFVIDIGNNEVVDLIIERDSKKVELRKGWVAKHQSIAGFAWKYERITIEPSEMIGMTALLSTFSGRPFFVDEIKVNTKAPRPFILELFDKARWGVLVSLVFLGTCLALLFYFLALSITDPKPEHWFFTLFMATITWNSFMIVDGGMDFNIVFKQPYHYIYLNDLFVNLTFITYTLFVYHFLEIKKHSKFLTRFIYLQIVVHVCMIVLCTYWVYAYDDLITVREKFSVIYLLSFVLSLVSLALIWKLIQSRLKYPIIIGSLLWSITSLIELSLGHGYTLEDFIVPEWEIFSLTVTQLGFFPIIIGYSLAIGYKNKLRDNEKYIISQKLVSQLEENKNLQQQNTQRLEVEVAAKSEALISERENSIKKEYENKILQLESDQLISQMNPHFIFNSLNSIKYYAISKETAETAAYITEFAQLMRTILDHSRKKLVSIEEECEFMLIYLGIEAKRFDNKFSFDIDCDDRLKVLMIPPMLIQPLAENAVVHGKLHLKSGGHVSILFDAVADQWINITIRDNGVGRIAAKVQEKHTKRTSHATQIMKDRIKVLNASSDLNIAIQTNDLYVDGDSNGTEVVIKVPHIKMDRKITYM